VSLESNLAMYRLASCSHSYFPAFYCAQHLHYREKICLGTPHYFCTGAPRASSDRFVVDTSGSTRDRASANRPTDSSDLSHSRVSQDQISADGLSLANEARAACCSCTESVPIGSRCLIGLGFSTGPDTRSFSLISMHTEKALGSE
jgi:hypothetical protein